MKRNLLFSSLHRNWSAALSCSIKLHSSVRLRFRSHLSTITISTSQERAEKDRYRTARIKGKRQKQRWMHGSDSSRRMVQQHSMDISSWQLYRWVYRAAEGYWLIWFEGVITIAFIWGVQKKEKLLFAFGYKSGKKHYFIAPVGLNKRCRLCFLCPTFYA